MKVHAQEPPAYFSFQFENELEMNEFMKEFNLGAFDYEILNRKSLKKYLKGEEMILDKVAFSVKDKKSYTFKVDNKIFLREPVIPYSHYSNIITLHIFKKDVKKAMSIFVRVDEKLREGDSILFENFEFQEGDYFIDLCPENTGYYPKKRDTYSKDESGLYKEKIDLSFLKDHIIKISKIERYIKKYNCPI